MRVAVVGTSGSGKTTMAKRIAAAFAIPHVELDAINWQEGWRDLSRDNPDEFVRRVGAAVAGERWVTDGNYTVARSQIWPRATHLVWMDYARPVIMVRVLRRSIVRALDGRELWAGNHEDWRRWLRPSHPIRWAWDTWEKNRLQYATALAAPENTHLTVVRLRHPREARMVLARLGAPDGHR